MTQPDCWRVIAASVQGKRHVETGLPCQDAHRWIRPKPNWLLIAVADGAGSQPLSDHGSRIATDAVIEYLNTNFSVESELSDKDSVRALFSAAFRHTFSRLETEATTRDVPLCSLATTLIAVVLAPDFVAAMQVGDGSVAVAGDGGVLFALTTPDNGEYIDLTSFVTDRVSMEQAQFQMSIGAFCGVAALTDGLQMQTMKAPSQDEPRWIPHTAFFSPFLEFARTAESEEAGSQRLSEYLSTEMIQDRSDDDITFVFAARLHPT